jgi:hypothetical protein
MKFLFCLIFSTLFVSTSSADVLSNASNFVDLILSIQKFYSAATIMFTHAGDYRGQYEDSLEQPVAPLL